MFLRAVLLAGAFVALTCALPQGARAQDINSLKAGVVRIHNTRLDMTGTGFVLKVESDRAYIITTAHVVKANARPSVFFLNRPNDAVPASVVNAEVDDQTGLALLEVKPADRETLKGLVPLKLSNYLAGGGEAVSVIGFPEGIATWSVARANVSRLEGRYLVIDRTVASGNSGGPVLYEGRVLGLVTHTTAESAYAVRAETIPIYVGGINRQLADSLREPETGPGVGINSLKAGVVRIRNNLSGEVQVGAGFIMKVDGEQIYVATAAHVVKGNQHPDVYLFNRQRDPLRAEVLDRQEDDVKGLALLRLKVPASIASGVTALKLSSTSQLGGGEAIKVIGFPDGTTFWTVDSGSIRRIEGHNLVFSGGVSGGNSGGPVILNGQVIGLVTDVSQSSAYAARAEAVELYVNGIEPNLTRAGTPATRQPENRQSAAEFCQTLDALFEASKGGFYSIVGKATDVEGMFENKAVVPGALIGSVKPGTAAVYLLLTDTDKGKVESLYYTYVTKVRDCYTKWEEKEASDSGYRIHKFRKQEGGPVLSLSYNLTDDSGYRLYMGVNVPTERSKAW